MEKKIKILFLTSLFGKMGGAEKNIYDIVLNIDRARFTPYVFCLKGGELVDDIRRKGIDSRIIDLDKIISLEGVRKGAGLYKFLKSEKIDIVVTYHHDADIWGGAIAMLAGVPAVVSSRRDLGYQLEKKHVWAYRALNRFYTRIISVSDAVKREIMRREWTPGGKIITVYNGVEIERYRQGAKGQGASLGIGRGKKVIGMLASLRPVKGHIHLVRAVAEVVRRNKDFQIVMVGYKDTDYYREVKEEIERLGLEDYFIFLGDRKDVPETLSSFDMMVLPSLSEGFSNAALEGMAAGKPVIATDCGGNPEAVIDNETGFLVPPADSHGLAWSILRLLDDAELGRRMGQSGERRVSRNFTLRNMIETNEDLFVYLARDKKRMNAGEAFQFGKTRLKKAAKLSLSGLFYYSGAYSVVKKKDPLPLVLAYHSINKVRLKPLEIEQEAGNFEKQVLFLKKNFYMLSLSEFLGCMNGGRAYPRNSVLMTFDDGYRDNYTNAFPVLKANGVPAAIFISTAPIETGEPLFFDALRYAVMSTSRHILDLTCFGLKKYLLEKSDEVSVAWVIREITQASKGMDNSRKSELTGFIYGRLGLDYEELKRKRLYLSWDEISEMAGGGIEFGSHTVTHPRLSALDPEVCSSELVNSKRIIEERTGRPVKTLAYPFGGKLEFNESVEKAAREAGYECAFSLCRGSNGFTMGRKMVDSSMTTRLNGEFSAPLFFTSLSLRGR